MADRVDMVVDQNATHKMTVEWRNADGTGVPLTGATFSLMIKDRPGGTLLANWSTYCAIDGAVAGRINITVPFAITAALAFEQGVYDLLVTQTGTGTPKTRLIQGRVIVDRGVST